MPTRRVPAMNSHQRLIDRVRKLLNLAASTNEHEAAAAAAKAHELLAQYNLSLADVGEDTGTSNATKSRTKTRKKLESWAFDLAKYVSEAFDCDYYHRGDGQTTFVGVGADAEVCAWTFGYLYKTLQRMASTYLREKWYYTSKAQRQMRASYLLAATLVVGKRLKEQKRESPVTSNALVPVKAKAIQDAMPDDLQERSFKEPTLDKNAVIAGAKAGYSISLATPVSGDSQAVMAMA
jgi:hypothetical protein